MLFLVDQEWKWSYLGGFLCVPIISSCLIGSPLDLLFTQLNPNQ